MSLILPEQQAIFLHIPKCAGQSIETALGVKHHHRHHKLNDLPDDWLNYFRFTFIRHPVSRFMSACKYNLHLAVKTKNQLEAMASSDLSPTKRYRLHLVRNRPSFSTIVDDLSKGKLSRMLTFQPQMRWLLRGQPQFIGRVEQLDQDFAHLSRLLGSNSRLVHTNRSKNDPSLGQISERDLTKVIDYYDMDFNMTGYPRSHPDS